MGVLKRYFQFLQQNLILKQPAVSGPGSRQPDPNAEVTYKNSNRFLELRICF